VNEQNDNALDRKDDMKDFLRQRMDEKSEIEESLEFLNECVK